MSFIKRIIEQETVGRRNLLPASTYGLCGTAVQGTFGDKTKFIVSVPTYDWNDFWHPSNGQIQCN